jgi:hypothetical protein
MRPVPNDTTIAAHCEAIHYIQKVVEHLEASLTLGSYRHALKAAESLVATLRPLAPSTADRQM